jgi:dihydrofolate reductase
MRPLRYSINFTLDGCCDHRVGIPDAELHQYTADILARADALILGRITYDMMESAWRPIAESGVLPEGMPEWTRPFAETIHAAKKYVVSDTLARVDWNAELVRQGDLEATVRRLKQEPGKGLYAGGVTMPTTLMEAGLIDEFEFFVHPRIAGHGPYLFGGLSKLADLKLVGRKEFGSGVVSLRYELRR